jgi:hypothetical protein
VTPLWTTPNAERATGYMSGAKADTWHPSLDWQARLAPEGPPPEIHAGNSPFAERGGRPTVAQLRQMVEEKMWPPPTVDDANNVTRESGEYQSLTRTVQMWPTPRMEGFDAGSPDGNPDSLHSPVKMLPTATAGDAKAARNATSGRTNPESGHHAGTTLTDVVHPTGMKLSADFVTWLMGYPKGYLDLEE